MTVLTFIAISNADYKENIKDIMNYAGVLTPQLNNEIDEESEKFQEASEFFTEKANNIDKKHKKRNCDTYHFLLSKDSFPSDQSFVNNPIQEWNVGSYKELEKYATTGDDLEHDHIPSYQSLISFLNLKGLKVKKNNRQVKNNGTAFEIKKSLHMNGATYGGKQNKQIDGVVKALFDSKNLRSATIRDLSYHFINSGYDRNIIKAFTPIYKRNLALCLYN